MSQKSSVPQAISFVSQVLKRDTLLCGRGAPSHHLASDGCAPMHDMLMSRAGRGPVGDLKLLSGLQRKGDGGVALNGRQNARRRHSDGGRRRRYQNTRWGHGTSHLCDSHLAGDLSQRE